MRNSVVLCLAYLVGLLLSGIAGSWLGVPRGAIAILVLSLAAVALLPRWWRTGPRVQVWACAGLIALLGFGYFHWRIPTPQTADISHWVTTDHPQQAVQVWGRIADEPRMTRSQSVRFWLQVLEAQRNDQPSLEQTGKLYVTVPLLQGTGLTLGQEVAIAGNLYQPQSAQIRGGFDFQAYLARQGSFAGLRGSTVEVLLQRRYPISALQFGFTYGQQTLQTVRQRMIRAQVERLGRGGLLVSSMVLGRRAVDLPYDLYEQFAQAGMAHTLAASGFHVSLLLGLVLTLSQGFAPRRQLAIAATILTLYVGLTGFHASVLRASFMGLAALLGMVHQRQVNSLRSLLTAATLLLLINPMWIWDLGFQLSFLATLGLVVTVKPMTKRLDWLPPNPANAIAIPISALIWTIPVQLYSFGVMPLYSIAANILLTPLVWAASLGGMITGAIALVSPAVGGYIVGLLSWPIEALIHSVAAFNRLPGHNYAIGQVAVWQVVGIYSLFILVWAIAPWRKSWWLAGLVAIALVIAPATYARTTQFQITLLPSREPVVVWQYRGQTGLINSGSDSDVQYSLLPFLRQQGVNHLDWAIALQPPSPQSGWYRLLQAMPVRSFSQATDADLPSLITPLLSQQQITAQTLSSITQLGVADLHIQANGAIATLTLEGHTWLLLNASDDLQLSAVSLPSQVDVLAWSGTLSSPELLEQIQPQVAIAPGNALEPPVADWFEQGDRSYVLSGRDGAIQWTPTGLQAGRSPQE